MTGRPEQRRAREYLRERGSRRPMAEIRERVRAAFVLVETARDRTDGETAGVRPAPGKWTVKETVDDLVESPRAAVMERRGLLQGRRPVGGPIPAGLRSPDPGARARCHACRLVLAPIVSPAPG